MDEVVKKCRVHRLFCQVYENGGLKTSEVSGNKMTWRIKYLKMVADEGAKPSITRSLSALVKESSRKRDKEYSESQINASNLILKMIDARPEVAHEAQPEAAPYLLLFQPAGPDPCRVVSNNIHLLTDPRVAMALEIATKKNNKNAVKKHKPNNLDISRHQPPREVSATDTSVIIVGENAYVKSCLAKTWPNDVSFPDPDTTIIDVSNNHETLLTVQEKCTYYQNCLTNKQRPIIF